MRSLRAFVRASILALGLLAANASSSFAQLKPSPKPEPGLCAPWHRCISVLTVGAVGLYVLFLLGMYAYQRRGFDRVEHRQGNPDGVPVKRD